jgi:hypothetical protein
MSALAVTGVLGGWVYLSASIASRCGDAPGWSLAPVDIDIIER